MAVQPGPQPPSSGLEAYLGDCRNWVLAEISRLASREGRYQQVLYDHVLDYPLRDAKALRPSLCVATCRALGGSLQAVLPSATALELYHNAFLVHDDVEDGSEQRRSVPTLHAKHGLPIAINTGDAMLALALDPLLENVAHVGLGKALRILEAVARMARESAEGQALELHWVRHVDWELEDSDYVEMVMKKTCWYSFVTPMLVGAIVAGVSDERMAALRELGEHLGVAFQIQDDVLNLLPAARYGKESCGDLWEGKHTLVLIHALRNGSSSERRAAVEILRKRRPLQSTTMGLEPEELDRLLADLEDANQVSAPGAALLRARIRGAQRQFKTRQEVEWLLSLIDRNGSIDYALRHARARAARARETFVAAFAHAPRSVHMEFVSSLIDFVVQRSW